MLHKNPSKNYGIASCRVFFYVIGDKGAVQWMIGTDWYPEAARDHLRKVRTPAFLAQFGDIERVQPECWDIGYHSRAPMYEGQTSMSDECHLLGGECYYDGSGIWAEEWREGFLNGGTDWLWPKLEEYYRYIFDGGELPDLTPQVRKHPEEIAA